MIEIRYSTPSDLEISGVPEELQFVRREILALLKSEVSQIVFEADSNVESAPYSSVLSKLVIAKGHCPTRVSLKNEKEIYVEGSPNYLEAFASFFDFKTNAGKGKHSHYEYYEGNDWIAPDSIPLVINVK